MNRVRLVGELGSEPELRRTPQGYVLKLRVYTPEDADGPAEWHRVTLWGKRGESLSKILSKGDRIFVEGRLQTSSYEKNGEKRYSTEVVARRLLLESGRRSA